jgi:(E)-2-((N-methylformamido)methylene)succinate hydrolase
LSVTNQDKRGTCYELVGQGPDLVLIHGLGLSHAMWQWQVPRLSDHYRVLTYDLLGHGASTRPRGVYSMTAFAAQLQYLTDELGIRHFALVGFSLGGMIAQGFTLFHADKVRALAVLHSAYDRTDGERDAIMARVRLAEASGTQSKVEAALERWFTAGFAQRRPEVLALVREWVLANDQKEFAACYRFLAEADAQLRDRIAHISCPTLVMTGDEDFGNSPHMARRMAARMPNALCRVLPGLRHMALAEAPDKVLTELLSFLDQTAGQ